MNRLAAPTTVPSRPWPLAGLLAAGAVLLAATALFALLIGAAANRVLAARTLAELEAGLRLLQTVAARDGAEALGQRIEDLEAAAPTKRFALVGADGRRLAGSLPLAMAPPSSVPSVLRLTVRPGESRLFAVQVMSLAEPARLLLAGREIEDQRALGQRIQAAVVLGAGLLAVCMLSIGFLVRRRLLQRIDAIAATAQAIMSGRLDERIPVMVDGGELERLARQLNAMLDRIDGLVTALGEVSDNIAHDLKTPLSRLRLTAEATWRDADQPALAREGLARIIDEADAILATFNAMLQIARLERGVDNAAMVRLDVAELVAETAELYGPVVEDADARLALAIGSGGVVSGNRQLLAQALANLIDNALKYGSSPAGTAVISLSVQATDERVEIAVADNGPGIAPADRGRVLGRFVRLESSRSKPGTGLGLSLVAAIVRLHQGTLKLEDAEPGLRVVIELPRVAAMHAKHADGQRDSGSATG